MLEGGVWAILDIEYDEEIHYKRLNRPFVVNKIKPIQSATIDIDEIRTKRANFTRDEWLNVMLRSVGMEPTHPDFSHRKRMLLLSRLIPMVENNFNLIELGPRGTGKSFVYREITPFAILIPGGKTTVPRLFMHLGTGRIGLVGLWDVVAFDEVAGVRFTNADGTYMLKDYMESGSFSRGKEEITANASMVFNGNIDGDIENILKTSHLFTPLPPEMQNMALIDRFHYYLPGWEVLKLKPNHLSTHYGFVVDYFAEFLRESRKMNFTDVIDKYFKLGAHLNQRDTKAVRKIVSGLIKLLHPDGIFTKEEVEEYLVFALEMRRRIKEQLKRMGGLEYWAVNFSYIDIDTGEEKFVNVPEHGPSNLIPPIPMNPGTVFTIGADTAEHKNCLFRIEVQAMEGTGLKKVTGAPSSAMKEAIQTAYDFVKANLSRLTVDKSMKNYDLHIQIVNLMQSKEGTETGVAFYVAILSALLQKPVKEQIVILGEMTIHGGLRRVTTLMEKLQIAMDSGAKYVMLPSENKRDIADIPGSILDKIQIMFYSDPIGAGFRAMGLE
jgi:ATP-dependent Lon protease